jgi:hypothetical protein
MEASEFLRPCHACGGSGERPNPNLGGPIGRGPNIVRHFGPTHCETCKGLKFELTDEGQKIADVVEFVINRKKAIYGQV